MTWNPNVTGFTATVLTMVISGSSLYVGGRFSAVGGQTRNCIAKIATTGAGLADATWNPAMSAGGSDQIRSIILNGTDLYVGGLFTSIGGQTRNNLAKLSLTGTGTADATWNPNINGLVGSLLVVGTDIYIGGFFAGANSVNGTTTRNNIAKISTTGTGLVDATWNPNPTVTSNSVDITSLATDGTDLFVGGYFNAIGGQTREHLAKLSLTGAGSADATWFPIPSGNAGAFRVSGLIVSGTQLYVSGNFDTMSGNSTYQGLCRLSTTGVGAVDATWDAKVAPFVKSITLSGTNLYVGLDYNAVINSYRTGFNAVTRQGLAKIDNATGNLDMTWNPNISNGGTATGSVSALALSGTNLFIGGNFTTVGGTPKTNLAKISTTGTGTLFTNWTNSVTHPTSTIIHTMVIDGTSLYVGGNFNLASGQTRNNVAKFSTTDLTTVDATWNPNANNAVNAIAVSGTDVFIGGNFTTINGGTSRNFLAKCTTTSSTVDATWNPSPNARVLALTVEGTNIYVGGLFASNPPTNSTISIGGAARNNIARLSTTGTGAADTFGAGAGVIGTGGIKKIILGQNSVYASGVVDDIYRLRKNSTPFIDSNLKLVVVTGSTNDMYLSGDILTIAGIFQIVRNTTSSYGYLTYSFANLSVNPDISYDATFSTFSGCEGTASSHQSFIVYGNHLTTNVTLNAPANFEISIDGGASYNTTQTITQTAGSIPNTTVRVRIAATATAGFGSSNIAITSGAITHNVAVVRNISASPTITLGTVTSVNTSATSFSLPFTASSGSPTTYSITAVAPNAMPSFVNVVDATFTGTSPITVTIPASGGGTYNFTITVKTGSCTSTAVPFTLTVTGPTIAVNSTMTPFTGCEGAFSPPTKTYTVTGSNLTGNITVTAPMGFEIKNAFAMFGMFGSTVTLSPISGSVSATIEVRVASTATGSPSGNITHASSGAGTQNVAVSATLTPSPTVTIGTVNSVLTSATSFVIPYTATTGSPNQYSVFANGPTPMPSFSNVMNQTLSGTSGNITVTIPASAANTYNFVLQVTNTVTGCSGGVAFNLTVAASLPPTITLSAAALTAFTSCAGTASTEQSYTVSGSNLTANISIAPPTGFEISTGTGGSFVPTNPITLTQTSGSVSSTTIYVRQGSGASNGASGNIAHTSGATTQNKAIPISTVNALPTITGVSAANVITSATSFNLAYTGTTGSPNQYSLTNVAPNLMTGFTPITDAALTASPIAVTIPASAAGVYNFNLTVRNTTTGCVSSVVPFTLTVTAAGGCTIYVRKDGNDANDGLTNTAAGAKLTLQAAFTAVNDGCTVVLNTGTYNETATLTNKSITLQNVGNPVVQAIVMNGAGKTMTTVDPVFITEGVNIQAGDIISNTNMTLVATATQQAMLIQGAGTNVAGNVNVQRYLRANTSVGGAAGLGYRFISSPTTDATLNQISELNPVVNVAYNTSSTPGRLRPFPTLYSYDPTKAGDPAKSFSATPYPDFDKGWVSPAALTEAMPAGRGYTINTASDQVLEITGLVNNGNVNIPIFKGHPTSLGHNLIGNPYPAPISWSAVLALSSGVDNAIYQNMATGRYTGTWASYVNGVGTNGATNDIAVMQGFFVIANADGNVVMNNSVRASTYKNPNSFRTEDDKNASKNQGLLRLAMTNTAGKTDETVVYFTEKATQNFDGQYDAVKFQLNAGDFPNIYTTDNKTLFSINALPQLNDDLIIPITVQSWTDGVQKIAMTEKLNFTREVQVFLIDKSNGKLHDLSKGGFEFSMSAGVLADRFELIFKPLFTESELNGDILSVYPNPTADKISVSIGDEYKGTLTLRLTDVSGREIWVEKTEKSGKIYQTSTSLENLASGTYFLEVEGSKKVVKKIVKQ